MVTCWRVTTGDADTVTTTPRRTVRMSDEEWDAGHAKAQAEGETLPAVLRRLLAGATCSGTPRLPGTSSRSTAVSGQESLDIPISNML